MKSTEREMQRAIWKRRPLGLGYLSSATFALFTASGACSDPFSTCHETRTCPVTGGNAGSSSESQGGANNAGADGGTGSHDAGASGSSQPGDGEAGYGGSTSGGGATGGTAGSSIGNSGGTGDAGSAPMSGGVGGLDFSGGAGGSDSEAGGQGSILNTGGSTAGQGGGGATGGSKATGGNAGSGGGSGGSGGCQKSTDCKSSEYCNNAKCVAKKVPGTVCANAGECSSNVCSGRCCNPGEACECPQPSSGNLLKNPGFDKNLSGWTLDPGVGEFTWHTGKDEFDGTYDATGCPFSGGPVLLNAVDDETYPQRLWQCVPVSRNKTYNYGGLFRKGVICELHLYPSINCSGAAQLVGSPGWLNVYWSEQVGQFDSMDGASARFSCYSYMGSDAHIDNVYLSLAPTKY